MLYYVHVRTDETVTTNHCLWYRPLFSYKVCY